MDLLEWRREVDRALKQLRQRTAKLTLRPSSSAGGGGGGGSGWIGAASYDLLPTPALKTIAYISAGPQKGQIYKLGYDLEGTAFWKCIDETYEATTKAGLTNNEYVQQFAVGRVGSIYYRRNEANNGWEAQNEFE